MGNRQVMTSSLSVVPGGSFSYDANDRLTDANGNTTSSAGISNTYDFENRMTGHSVKSHQRWTGIGKFAGTAR